MKFLRHKAFMKQVSITTLALFGVISIVSYGVWYFMPEKTEAKISENDMRFQSAYSNSYGSVGVALSTRIGLGIGSNMQDAGDAYSTNAKVWENYEEKREIRSALIRSNLMIIREYLNLSRTDVKVMLSNASDRRSVLEWFISELEHKRKNSILSVQSLEAQKSKLLGHLEKIDSEIETSKIQMEWHFEKAMVEETLSDVDTYFDLRRQYTETFTDIVFINQFLKQHIFLTRYNETLLDTLRTNKEQIINKTYVVIPDSGSDYMRELKLIFDENEMK